MFLAPFCGQSAPKVDNMLWLPASAGNHKLMGVVDITCDITCNGGTETNTDVYSSFKLCIISPQQGTTS